MDAPLHENVAMGNEPKVAPGRLQAQAPVSASRCACTWKRPAAFSFYSHQSETFLLQGQGLFLKLS